MKFLLITLGLLLAVGLYMLFSTSAVRYLKSAWLILQISPYEQIGTGSGQVVILGDSTGYGTGASAAKDTIAGRLGQDFPAYTIKNYSRNAATLAQVRAIAEKKLAPEQQYDLILIQAGANNIIGDIALSVSEAELRSLLELTTNKATAVVMMSSGNVGGSPAFAGEEAETMRMRTLEYRTMFKRVAAEYGVAYVDLYEEPADDIFVKEPTVYMAFDGLHPSSRGYEKWYRSLLPVVEEILVRSSQQ